MVKMARDTHDRKKAKNCSFCADKVDSVDYKDAAKLKRYLTEAGKIIPRRVTGNCAKHQRMIVTAIKRAREASIINYTFD
jgi:small subunit ribosomal protein S18